MIRGVLGIVAVVLLLAAPSAIASGVRYRVTLAPGFAPEVSQVAAQLAASCGGTVEEESGGGFTLLASPSMVQVIEHHPAVARLEEISVAATASALDRVTSLGTSTWSSGKYQYDGAGNIRKIGTDLYVYDSYNRLIEGTVNGQSQHYTYDRFGNLKSIRTGTTTITLGTNAATNQLTRTTDPETGLAVNSSATYDAAGQLKSWNGGGGTFEYDALGMMTSSSNTIDGEDKIYLYTPGNERIAIVIVENGVEVRSEWTLRDASGKVLRRLDRSRNGAQSIWTWRQDYVYAGSRLLASEVDTAHKTLHYFADHLGTPRLITGNGGVQIARHDYFPFGAEATATYQDSERMKFTGHERDPSGLDYMHARYYSFGAGRFLSVDPSMDLKANLPNPQRWNRYSYVSNNPINKIDPDGRDEWAMAQRQLGFEDDWEGRDSHQVKVLGGLGAGAVVIGGAVAAAPAVASFWLANKATILLGAMGFGNAMAGGPSGFHGHHTYLKALGGHPKQSLARILAGDHIGKGTGVHSQLAKFEGGWLNPTRGMTGAKIVEKYGANGVVDGLRRFYSQAHLKHLLPKFEEAVKFTEAVKK